MKTRTPRNSSKKKTPLFITGQPLVDDFRAKAAAWDGDGDNFKNALYNALKEMPEEATNRDIETKVNELLGLDKDLIGGFIEGAVDMAFNSFFG